MRESLRVRKATRSDLHDRSCERTRRRQGCEYVRARERERESACHASRLAHTQPPSYPLEGNLYPGGGEGTFIDL